MNILAINGSHKGKTGVTQILIDELFAGATNAGGTCQTIILKEKKILQCKGCFACQSEKSYLKCIYAGQDDVTEIISQMKQADIIIYATPVYNFTISSLLKKFIERLTSTSDCSKRTVSEAGLIFHHIDTGVFSKPFVTLVCQDNFETETSLNITSYFKSFSRFCDAPIVGTLVRKSGFLMKRKTKLDEGTDLRIDAVSEAYRKAGEELARYGKITAKTQRCANVNLLPIPKVVEFVLRFKFARSNKVIMKKILQRSEG